MLLVWNVPIVASVGDILREMKMQTGLPKIMKEDNQDFMISCPFHKDGNERNPSCGVSKIDKVKKIGHEMVKYPAGTVHCYTCGWTGDIPKFVADLLGLGSPIDGYKWLIKRYNFGSADERADLNLDLERYSVVMTNYINEDIVNILKRDLWNSQKAMDYMTLKRGISKGVLEKFDVGFNAENNTISFPVRDAKGNVVFTKERDIGGKRFHNEKDKDKTSVVFGLYEVLREAHRDRTVWICESEIDAMTLWGWGELAIAIMGSHISQRQVDEIARTSIRKLRDGMDNDSAGRVGMRKIKDLMIPLGFRIWNTQWGIAKKDMNELTYEEFLQLGTY